MSATFGSARKKWTAVVLVLGIALLVPAWAGSMSGRADDRVAVSCDTEGTEVLDQVCTILIGRLNEAGDGEMAFVADNGATSAAIHVRLETVLASRSSLSGRLHWRQGRDGVATAAPEVTLTVSDGELTTRSVGNFARALIEVSELPTSR